jgi:phosphoserine phosphatase RsbU/P
VEIRHTAARNLALGLGAVCLALIGILPISHRITKKLAILTRGAEQLAGGDLQTRVPVTSKDEFGRLAETFNRMAGDLAEHERRMVEQERIRQELEMGRRIQEEMVPRQPLRSGLIEVQGVSVPAREVGGDFFNYFALPGHRIALLIGDVSGKGIAAALLMANVQATLQARLPLGPDLAALAAALDSEIAASTPPEVYLTLFMGILDEANKTLRYVNAGHHTQFALRADGGTERLQSTGRPLGLVPGGGYTEQAVPLEPGDLLFLYTDGLVETENAAGDPFGFDRLEQLLVQLRQSRGDRLLAEVEQRVREHRAGAEPADDATMVVLKTGAAVASQM